MLKAFLTALSFAGVFFLWKYDPELNLFRDFKWLAILCGMFSGSFFALPAFEFSRSLTFTQHCGKSIALLASLLVAFAFVIRSFFPHLAERSLCFASAAVIVGGCFFFLYLFLLLGSSRGKAVEGQNKGI